MQALQRIDASSLRRIESAILQSAVPSVHLAILYLRASLRLSTPLQTLHISLRLKASFDGNLSRHVT